MLNRAKALAFFLPPLALLAVLIFFWNSGTPLPVRNTQRPSADLTTTISQVGTSTKVYTMLPTF